MLKILVVDDNIDLSIGLSNYLQSEGYQVSVCHDGCLALSIIDNLRPNLIILDMMLPLTDSYQIIKQIRKRYIESRVLCLSSQGEEIDKVRALRSGADDYLMKPFGLMEMAARVEALFRRFLNRPHQNLDLLFLYDIKVYTKAKQVVKSGVTVDLTPKEFQLLLFLLDNPNVVHSRSILLQQVWGHMANVNSRTVDTHISELRKKLKCRNQKQKFIITVPKSGYKLVY